MSKANRKLSILLIDDESFVLNLSLRVLKKLGYESIVTASNGMEGLKALAGAPEPFDVVICDLNMPEMDGVEFMRHAAEREFSGGVIFLSGEDERMLETAHDLARDYDLNILGALAKPLTPDALKPVMDKFKPRVKKSAAPQSRITEKELREGMAGAELELVFQPKISIKSGQITGVETLARWHHATRGVLGPGAFIGVAERIGAIDELTDQIYRRALGYVGDWSAEGINLKTSINFSVNTFSRPGIADVLVEAARQEGVDPSLIVLEVTEGQLMEDALNCLEVLMRLRLKKFSLSIDDFGTGHSSLEQLKRIPFTELKVDRAFVFGAVGNRPARTILEYSVDLAKKMGMEIVAEGVETREDWDLVESLGCDYVQGFYCAKPMTPGELIKFLGRWNGPH